jgi:hypothetical protein
MMGSIKASQREVGSTIPVSIPTASALEAVTEWPQAIWINTRTLIRNLLSSMETATRDQLRSLDIYAVIKIEMELIQRVVGELSKGVTEVTFYCCNYSDLSIVLPNAIPRKVNTDLQLHLLKLEMDVLKSLIKDGVIKEFKTKLDGKDKDVLILTHHCLDLLWSNTFRKLRLLESHTGTVKTKTQWHTKLTNGKELPEMPFNKFTVQVFGDNNVVLSQSDRKLRAIVVNMATENRWSSVTTMEKIRFNINGLKDHFAKTVLLKYCQS